jgi:hypothetical protein
MPRTIEIAIPQEKTRHLIERARNMRGVTGISLYPSTALFPGRDIVTLDVTNNASPFPRLAMFRGGRGAATEHPKRAQGLERRNAGRLQPPRLHELAYSARVEAFQVPSTGLT